MVSLKSFKKSCRVSSPEGVLALFASALIGLSMVVLVPERNLAASDLGADKSPAMEGAPNDVSADLAANDSPVVLDLEGVNLEKIVRFCVSHTTASRGFVVFRNGTCVLVNEPSKDPVTEARSMLSNCAKSEARFLSETTAEGDLVVTFERSVFHWIPGSEIGSLEDWSLANLGALLTDHERDVASPDWVPPAKARLGLVSRKRLLDDARSGEVVKILRPNTSVASISK